MGVEYTVKKNKYNRYGFRGVGLLFIVLAVALVTLVVIFPIKGRIILGAIGIGGILYGAYLLRASFRKQAYDVKYQFTEEGINVVHRYGETLVTYDEVKGVNAMQPDPNMLYKILQIKTEKEQYVLSFEGNVQDCDTLYALITERMSKDEEQE